MKKLLSSSLGHVVFLAGQVIFKGLSKSSSKAQFRSRSTHVQNLTDELSMAKKRRMNQFGTMVLVWCGKSVTYNMAHGTPSESDVAPVSLQGQTYSVRFST